MSRLIIVFIFILNNIIFASYSFLKLPHDAKTSAFGNNPVSITGAFAVYYNPALILYNSNNKHELAFSTNKFYGDLSAYNIVYNFPHRQFRFSFSFENCNIKDIPYYPDYPVENPISFFSSHFLNFAIGTAFNLNKYIALGLSGNLVYQKLYENASSYAYLINFGIGVMPIEGLLFGGSFNNMGISTKIDSRKLNVPSYYSVGVSYNRDLLKDFSSFISVNYKKFDSESLFSVGGGIKFYNIVQVLFSNTTSKRSYFFNKLSYGVEVYYKKFIFIYSLQNTVNSLDNTKLITISRVF